VPSPNSASTASDAKQTNKAVDAWFGEPPEQHSHDVAIILRDLRLDEASISAAGQLHSNTGKDALIKQLGQEAGQLLIGYRGLRQAQAKLMKQDGLSTVSGQEEILRKMLLAFGNDLRVVLIYLASRLQTLRWVTKNHLTPSPVWAQEILDIDASLANRLGIWQMKWEMEDLAFRVLSPATYKEIAGLLDSRRVEREQFIKDVIARLKQELQTTHITADVQGRPKQSLHTVVIDEQGIAFEIQIRTQAMHQQAEYGLAAHWRYKEGAYSADAKDAGTHSAEVAYERQIAWARQLISWKEDAWEQLKHHEIDDHIYVLTPLGKVIALEKGSSAIDFAYAVHTDLGHRCRGARIDGAMVPLDTALSNGQTIEIISVKQGGPSRDWLNPERGYLRSQRARARVRAWFNALDDEASQSVPKPSETKTEKPTDKALADDIQIKPRQSKANQSGDVLVVGVDSLLTQLAKCCRPVPPDPIAGFVTQGRGVSIHRRSCKTFRALLERAPERVIQTAWSAKLDPEQGAGKDRVFPADLAISALDRPELMRELFEITSKIGVHVIDLKKSVRKGLAQIQLTVEIQNTEALRLIQTGLESLRGVTEVRRR